MSAATTALVHAEVLQENALFRQEHAVYCALHTTLLCMEGIIYSLHSYGLAGVVLNVAGILIACYMFVRAGISRTLNRARFEVIAAIEGDAGPASKIWSKIRGKHIPSTAVVQAVNVGWATIHCMVIVLLLTKYLMVVHYLSALK